VFFELRLIFKRWQTLSGWAGQCLAGRFYFGWMKRLDLVIFTSSTCPS
jgi:hypothetical protein